MSEPVETDKVVEMARRVEWPTLEDLALWKFAAKDRDPSGSLEGRYRSGRRGFEARAGSIVQEWWGSTAPGGVVVTWERRPSRIRTLSRDNVISELHRSTGLVTADVPECEPLLALGDDLSRRAGEILRGSPQRIVVARLFGLAVALLAAIEATTRRRTSNEAGVAKISEADAGHRMRTAAKRYAHDLRDVEAYYNRTATRSAQFDYFSGVARGVIWVAVIIGAAVLTAGGLLRWAEIVVPAETYALLIAAVVAGALGACVSVMWRMSTGDFISDYEAGAQHLRMIGVFRPLIGATFGLAMFFVVQADLASFGNDDPNFWLLTFIAFLSGFSERFAPDVFGRIEGAEYPSPQAPAAQQQAQLEHAVAGEEFTLLVPVESDTDEPAPRPATRQPH